MIISKKLATIISIISGGMIWAYIGIFFVCMYLLISLLTWSFIKPLKYLGIPTTFVGILFLLLRLFSGIVAGLLKENISIINAVLPGLLQPVLVNGILCVLVGIAMIVLYTVINKKRESKLEEKTEDISH